VEPIDKLINIPLQIFQTFHGSVAVPGFVAPTSFDDGTTPANWSAFALSYCQNQNLMTIFSAMMSWLDGEFLATVLTNNKQTRAIPSLDFTPRII
jgi:hypothetical protein